MRFQGMLAATVMLLAAACEESGGNGEIRVSPELAARARVTTEAAQSTALSRVPGGTVRSGELEEEDGRLVYSFDIVVEGQRGVQEVVVDAVSGQVVSEEHETEAQEAAEASEERESGAEEAEEALEGSTAPLVEEGTGLMTRVQISDADARAAALARVPGGRIVKAVLEEEEEGLLIYSYDIRVQGETGIREVHVDALTGEVVKIEHERGDGGS